MRKTGMDVGIFNPLEPAGMSPRQFYADVLDRFEAAERAGYRSVWLASRHFSPLYAACGSPLVLLAAAATCTERIELGTAIVTLPLEHPLKLAEDYATLDALSGGRGRLGVGSGDDPPAFEQFEVSYETRSAVTSAAIGRLQSLLSGDGPVYPPPSVSELYVAGQSTERARWAAEHKLGLLMGRSEPGRPDPTQAQVEAAGAYRAAGGRRLIVSRNAWVGDSGDPLLASALARHDAYLQSRGRDPLPSTVEEAVAQMHIPCGPPDVLAKRLHDDVSAIQPDELLVTVDPGGLEAGEASRRLSALAKEILV
jgi:alkanesulfonate monooxygenase SsuD/methylene tetrahydromethanopterin reductase-like flavin-dependent oxidoreductase (luciferase family)